MTECDNQEIISLTKKLYLLMVIIAIISFFSYTVNAYCIENGRFENSANWDYHKILTGSANGFVQTADKVEVSFIYS